MATARQIEANRLNAQKCTGPKTEDGKARSSQNALKTGLYAEVEVIAAESREDYEALIAEYHEQFAPATVQERSLVDALIRYEWLSRRYMAADAAVWNFSLANSEVPHFGLTYIRHSETLARATRALNTARRGYAATLKELEALQSRRKAVEAEQAQAAAPVEAIAESQTELTEIKQLDPKLVSFRQFEFAEPPESKPLTRSADLCTETPPLAA